MEGLNPAAAYEALYAVLSKDPLPETLSHIGLEKLLRAAIEYDIVYMDKVASGGVPYDDDDAWEAIADPITRAFSLEDDAEQDACEWVDAYMEAMAEYLERNRLIDWL